VTDGESVYLSDAVSLEEKDLAGRTITAGRYAVFQKGWFTDWAAVTERVEAMKKAQLESSVVLARFWNESGTYWLDLTG